MITREPAVAGSFYTDSARQLKAQVDDFLAVEGESEIQPKALIVPHAGYCYSGAVAGEGYACLKNYADKIKRVVLLGPSHRVYLKGCAISSYQYFNTPLGQIETDSDAYQQLLNANLVEVVDPAHQQEHSLEVQLPFLQEALNDFKIVPIVVGISGPENIREILNLLQVNSPETLVVISSDLSHYNPYELANTLDDITIKRILNHDNTLAGEDACGCHAINGLLAYSNQQNWQVKLVKHANSGDVSTIKDRVVGYASFVLY